VPDAGSYGGYPLQPLKDAMKTAASLGQLNEIRKKLNRVMKHLHLLDKVHVDKVQIEEALVEEALVDEVLVDEVHEDSPSI
jgi:hypothetical protein